MATIQSILVPVDGSPPSLAALDHALALAEDGDARIDVLHVEDPDQLGGGLTLARAPRREVEQALADAIAGARARLGARVSSRTEIGEPVRTIVTTASDGHHDLIVIGTHGRVGRLHSLLGSVAEGVVRNATCPVLTVREPGSDYQSFAERRHGRPTLADQVADRH